jgi:SAM-dependent methyltransferase
MNDYGRQLTDAEIAARAHRQFVGGLWDELGALQCEFVKRQGLRATDWFLDVGCGALRGGIHFIRFLERGHYCGMDINESLVRAGRMELESAGLIDRDPQLVVDGVFRFAKFGVMFDCALAQSVFTHLPMNAIQRCLNNMRDVLKPGCRFFATYFEAPAFHHLDDITHPGGTVTHSDADPYHYHFSVFEWLVAGLPFAVRNVGEWGHPFNQHMLEFVRL